MVNVTIGASVKRRDMLREKHSANTFEALNNGELSSGRGLNQETMIKRPGDTRWGSHYITLVRCISMFSSICEVLEIIIDDGSNSEQKYEAKRKDQDFVNAMNLVKICKVKLQSMRESGWQSLLDEVSNFCNKHVIDMQLQELNNRFTEKSTELLLCVACLNPSNSFTAFDRQKLICLAQFYPRDLSTTELLILEDQLQNYIIDVCSDNMFVGLTSIGDLSQKNGDNFLKKW
ncbi:uncharacterized protein LOC127148823 [Cucumis melo]|uniref:Uncharacterized protein LOC127148823 n=1 Tax=Cucumis melo TaxID=3656 RepID=A0ABM3KMX0_CUCME|nr:uncharacterized protein LOC127148823 [Cucumis melo]